MDQQIVVAKISDGLGLGVGSISGAAIATAAGQEVMKLVDRAIESPDILVDVSRDGDGNAIDDDGCGDGRITKTVMRGHEPLHRSLHRAKVFGGGATMTAADLIGAGKAGDDLLKTFGDAIDELTAKSIDFGAHTAEHVSDPTKCGCGAIDESPTVVAQAVANQEAITAQIVALGVSGEGLEVIFDNYTTFAERIASQAFSGNAVMDAIITRNKIVKQLAGVHLEARIVLNYVQGKTLNQQLIHTVSGGKVDIFGVDVWRMQELAAKLHPGDKPAEQRALQSMLVYTLAVAVVLTKGDLPVYSVQGFKERQ